MGLVYVLDLPLSLMHLCIRILYVAVLTLTIAILYATLLSV